MLQPPPIVLSFSANDSSGGAGIQADTLTLASKGCHSLPVITAVTVQNTVGVDDVMALDSRWVEEQARAVLDDMSVHAFKIGMLGSVENIVAIAKIVSEYPDIPVVLDPILSSGRGDELVNEDMITAICNSLVPQTTIITPNSIEARRLVRNREEDSDEQDLGKCSKEILNMGCKYVLVTGTHENTHQVENILYADSGIVRSDIWKRLIGSYHGSGCTLASAIAANLANGMPVSEGVYEAQEYTWQTLKNGFHPGVGQYLPDRLFWVRNKCNSTE
ncbi:MAG: bifunctional hydroxymethylpyrimidine kinase/phosphomethylpyrimidine kinase [Nitrosomonadaceae bacterium]|nr:bifunctional hydroxymethylpyrimidine kinase/phosphomethylpyrimidine kinase [Nitrosomonadaceae bacterium]|tara:strand:+ start:479 stop:1303 length:825 start_codon:yes stop_codon:yes gene_type:complete